MKCKVCATNYNGISCPQCGEEAEIGRPITRDEVAMRVLVGMLSNEQWQADWAGYACDAFDAADAFMTEMAKRGAK